MTTLDSTPKRAMKIQDVVVSERDIYCIIYPLTKRLSLMQFVRHGHWNQKQILMMKTPRWLETNVPHYYSSRAFGLRVRFGGLRGLLAAALFVRINGQVLVVVIIGTVVIVFWNVKFLPKQFLQNEFRLRILGQLFNQFFFRFPGRRRGRRGGGGGGDGSGKLPTDSLTRRRERMKDRGRRWGGWVRLDRNDVHRSHPTQKRTEQREIIA